MDLSCETQIRLGGPNSLLMICLEPTDGVLRPKTRTCGFACLHWLPTITGCQHSQGLTSIKLMMPACTSCQHINTTNFSRSDKALVHTASPIFNTLPSGGKKARSVNRDPLIPLINRCFPIYSLISVCHFISFYIHFVMPEANRSHPFKAGLMVHMTHEVVCRVLCPN
jgi:hypothetical protein